MVGLAGWLAAGCATCLAICAWRVLGVRMEAVVRACHELRGPITAARLGLQVGVRSGELSPDRLRALDLELGRAGLALEDLSSARAGPLRARRHGSGRVPEAVDVSDVVHASAEAWRASAAERDAQLRAAWEGEEAYVLGDRLRIAQATGNLIANAVEHGGRSIEIRGSSEAACVRIEVADDGPGLPAAVAELRRRARNGRGQRGRGLAIASEIAHAHGGRLFATPVDRGAALVLELPRLGAKPGG
jgi:signal transduction histidine kinase